MGMAQSVPVQPVMPPGAASYFTVSMLGAWMQEHVSLYLQTPPFSQAEM
jgi:hypothetical protein